VSVRIARPEQRAEAPRVPEPERFPVGGHDVRVIVRAGRLCGVGNTHAPGHAEMEHERAGVRFEKQVFGPPPQRSYEFSGKLAVNIGRHGPAQPAVPNRDADHSLTFEPGSDPAAGGFDFRQFWHNCARDPTHILLVSAASEFTRFSNRRSRRRIWRVTRYSHGKTNGNSTWNTYTGY
jgi:hypothetical protein